MEKTISRKELYELGWTKPLTAIAKEFKLSYHELKLICKNNNIPTPPNGYWQKIAFGKDVTKTPLPNKGDYEKIITIKGNEAPKKLIGEVSSKKTTSIKVPNKLSNPDIITQKLQSQLSDREKHWIDSSGLIRTGGKNPKISVTKSEIPRALRIFVALIKNFRALNYQIVLKDENVTIFSLEEYTHIFIREKCKAKYVQSTYSWPNRILTPTGKLAVKVGRWGEFEFAEAATIPLEEKIDTILLKIRTEFQEAHERNIRREAERVKKEEEDKIAEAIRKRKENELNRFLTFFNDAHRWKKFIVLQEYFHYLKENKLKDQEEIGWIAKKLEWYNPSIKSSDDLLSEVNKETLTFIKKKSSYF